MFILDLDKVGEYLEDIAYGFETSVVDILITVGFVLLFILFLILIYIVQQRKKREERVRNAAAIFSLTAKKRGLTDGETDVAEQLSSSIENGDEYKHYILKNQAAFDKALRIRGVANESEKEIISSLRRKLEFTDHTEKRVRNTTQLPIHQHLYVIPEEGKGSLHGWIESQKNDGLYIRLREPHDDRLNEGSFVEAFFTRGSGVYQFSSYISEQEPMLIKLRHTEYVSRVQRRSYYRKQVVLPVELKKPSTERTSGIHAFTYDLGGGGIGIDVPPSDESQTTHEKQLLKELEVGNRYVLLLTFPSRRTITVEGKLVRTSKNGKRLHIVFDSIKEGERDTIIKYVFNIDNEPNSTILK